MSRAKPCKCGLTPKIVADRLGEDLVETHVRCDCGERGPAYEHWRSDPENAIHAWNCGDREPPQCTCEGSFFEPDCPRHGKEAP